MRELLRYPFDGNKILQKRRSIRKELIADQDVQRIRKRIAVLCGSTASDITKTVELFLLDQGIEPVFYESEYNRYYEDIMFDNPELREFEPDLIYIHTTVRNITAFPTVKDNEAEIESLLRSSYEHYEVIWERIAEVYHCPIIQNNFDPPVYRLMGNRDVSDIHGRRNFVNRLNDMFYQYARSHDSFYINDIAYQAADYGLYEWQNPFYWHMYKYALAVPAIPQFAYNLASIVKSIYGKNKKGYVLDLDNTLWGGIVGDDGPENIEIGQETAKAQVFSEFQTYLKEHKDLGVMLNIDSKNEEENALAGLKRPDSVLAPDDFLVIKANWEPKDRNLLQIADEINIGADSLVFVDDNPAERHIVRENLPGVEAPEITTPDRYVQELDRAGYFEVTSFSDDDLKRNSMYKANAQRARQQAAFTDYSDYLKSLEMTAEIGPFPDIYMARIAQLTNKSNQFNLTTRRYSQADIEGFAADDQYITLYGKLVDKFGDNGVVAVTLGHEDEQKNFHIDLWLMSCRVLKRDLEYAMMDQLVRECKKRGINNIFGYYYPTAKNKIVKDFYGIMKFDVVSTDEEGNSIWKLSVGQYKNRNNVIKVEESDG